MEYIVRAKISGKLTPETEDMEEKLESFVNYYINHTDEGKAFLESANKKVQRALLFGEGINYYEPN